MPSPKWSQSPPLLAAAIAAAVSRAWEAPESERTQIFHGALRQMVGADDYERVQRTAHDVWLLQEVPPEGLHAPPEWAWFSICPRCQTLRGTKYTAPQNGRLKLQVLRDPNWLAAQFEKGRSANEIGKQLGCSGSLVVDWATKHGLLTPRSESQQEIEAVVRRMHFDGEAPGTIGKHLRENGHEYMQASRVREVLARLGLATKKRGQVYHEREWWRVRLEDRKLTANACAREAGIKPHAALYWVKRFNLNHITAANRKRGKPKKYPELYNASQLRALLARNGDNYEAAAREIGCTSSALVSRQARKLLGWGKRHHNHLPHSDREWWTERLERGATTYELAEEAGVEEKTAREKLRLFGLLPEGYANNTRRERERRKAKAA